MNVASERVPAPSGWQAQVRSGWRRIARIDRLTAAGRSRAVLVEAFALTADLGRAALEGALREGARAFAEGRDEGDRVAAWVLFAVSARAVLAERAAHLRSPALDVAIAAVDARLAPFEEAVLLLAPAEYAQAMRGAPIDPRAWWGLPLRLESLLPLRAVDEVLAR